MSAQGPGWLDEPEHDEPVGLAQAVSEWAGTAAPLPLEELAGLNPGLGPKELRRLQLLEQLLAEDDLECGGEGERP